MAALRLRSIAEPEATKRRESNLTKVSCRGAVAQSVERHSKGPGGSVHNVVGKIINPSRAIWQTTLELSARIGNVAEQSRC